MILKRLFFIAVFCLSAATLFAQTKTNYDARWKVVDSLLNRKGLTASALAEVTRIYATAKQEHNDAQQIKALIFRFNLNNLNQEDVVPANLKTLDSAITGAQQPARSILQSLAASGYWFYLQQNRWKLYNRTTTVNFVKTDIATWSMDDFNQKISSLYLASLQEEKLLVNTKLESYEPIIIKGNVRRLRPSLFDLLAHEALNYFQTGEQAINKPADEFEIDNPLAFSDAATFAVTRFTTTDTSSLHYKALLLLQRLINLHLGDALPDALVDVDIERVGFVYLHAVIDNKEELYRQALQRITNRYADLPAAAQAWYLQALSYAGTTTKGETPADTTRYSKVRAKAICEKVLAQKDSSEGRQNCLMLYNDLVRKTLSLTTEMVNMPGQPLRCLVSWSNFNKLYLRIISLDNVQAQSQARQTWDDAYWDKLLHMPVYSSSSQSLPITDDYRVHSTEMAVGSLVPGAYVVLGCSSPDWKRTDLMVVEYFYVSSIAYINQNRDYFVVNRQSGQPLSEASVQVWKQAPDSRNGAYQLQKAESYITDKEGHFLLNKIKDNRDYASHFLEIKAGGDRLFLQDAGVPYSYFSSRSNDPVVGAADFEVKNAQTFLFRDRSIYRPGQTLYFKGIVVTKDPDTKKTKVLADHRGKVILYNANNEKIDSLELQTNTFGSYHGTFRLPENQLNGQFRIVDSLTGASSYFSVEEYKRPTFYVDYDKQKESYRVGDSIRVTGNAKAYAGNGLDGARVKYRVVRKPRFRPWFYWRNGYGGHEQEIKHGEVRTDSKGAFRINFPALPDRSIPPAEDPRFDYEVTADVTDINGETRSGLTKITAGYTVLNLSVKVEGGDHQAADSVRRLTVSTTNLADEPVASRVQVTLYPLNSPKRLIRARLWQKPDLFVLTESVFLDSFPHDEYREETRKEEWQRETKVWEGVDSTNSHIRIPAGTLSPGWYLVETKTTDKYGQEVKDLHYIELFEGKTGRPASPQYNWVVDQQSSAEPGDKAWVETGSSAKDVFVISKLERSEEESGNFSTYLLNNEKRSREFTLTEADRGGFGVSEAFVKDNRLYTHQSLIRVPWTNKQLSIHYTTYRDKTEPGSGEKWQISISGGKGEKVSAEVLAAMYDASLDQFAPHSWAPPALYPEMGWIPGWQSQQNFTAAASMERPVEEPLLPAYNRIDDHLLSFYGNANSGRRVMLRGVKTLDAPGVANQHVYKNSGDMFVHAERLKHVDSVPMPVAPETAPVRIRKNFNETAFFFPDLRTDSAGNLSFSFTMPEALTRWKWMTLAHTSDLAFGYGEKSIITQKQLMVQPNVPRFLREGDHVELAVKVVNLTDSELTGQMVLQLTDPTTGQTADGWFANRQPNQYFTVGAGQSAVVSFPLVVPFQYNRPLTYRIVAQSRGYSDGEEATLPVVSNRMLVTETLPLNMKGNGTRHFTFDKLIQSGASETLNHHALTVEFTANPAWYAVQSLPYLIEYPYECAEQIFNRFYANVLAGKIVSSSPRLQEVFARWRTQDTAALLSNLQKNQELKTVLLEETPWVLQGKTEEQQKKNIALLFDMSRMSKELEVTLDRLIATQSPGGGFAWFKGGNDDLYITQYILTGIGHLQKLQAIPAPMAAKVAAVVKAALPYVDGQIKRIYNARKPEMLQIGALPVQYLYMRSFFSDYGIPGDVFPAVNFFRKRVQQSWVEQSKYLQGMIALALFRTGDVQTAKDIIKSLRQNAILDEEKGMYWKGMEGGYYWYEAPVETQSLLIEAFREISGDAAVDRDLKTWLLKQKQTHSWRTTKATADACYALLLGGQDWLNAEREVEVKLGEKVIEWGSTTTGDGVLAIFRHTGPGNTAGE